jgi:dihydrofolate reductase
MGKIILFNMVTLEGFFSGLNGEIDWHHTDDEFDHFAAEQLSSVDTLLFGRITYEGMASYWTTEAALINDPIVAEQMNSLSKIVVSRTLEKADWQNTTLLRDAEALRQLKEQSGKDLMIFGSARLSTSLTHLGLIDEYRIMVNPVILGEGIPLFSGVNEQLPLKLLITRAFRSGNVLLIYQPLEAK